MSPSKNECGASLDNDDTSIISSAVAEPICTRLSAGPTASITTSAGEDIVGAVVSTTVML